MTTKPAPTKLIEVALPLDVINREAAREKSIRFGHPSTLHPWWARRPLAACRAVLFAQLVDDPSAHPGLFPTPEAQALERERLFGVIRRLVPWEATSNEAVLEEARAEIRRCYPDGPPPIVDPFSGGGSIPLEAQRLGLTAYASDLNPVPVLISKALLEIAPPYADRGPVHPADETRLAQTERWQRFDGLADDVRWYGQWIHDEARRRLGHLYPPPVLSDGSSGSVVAWIWARTVTCPNPACRSAMPLVRSFWLGKKKGKEVWVNPLADRAARRVRFEIGHGRSGPPSEGTVGRRGATCLVCGSPVSLDHIKTEGSAGRMSAQLMAVAVEGHRQRVYLAPTPEHERAAVVAQPSEFPDAELSTHPQYMGTVRYGMTRQSDLYTNRQLTTLCTLSDLVLEARDMITTASDDAYAAAVSTFLAFAVSRLANENSTACTWASDPGKEHVRSTFSRQAIAMAWDFAEAWPFTQSTGGILPSVERVCEVVRRLRPEPGSSEQASAMDRSFEGMVVSTDPPYYDNVPYADLSDYFYVWLRRTLRSTYPALLSTMVTPKAEELVADHQRFGGRQGAENHFETGFQTVFKHVAELGRSDTPMTIYYAFKQSNDSGEDGDGGGIASTGWEKLLQGLVDNKIVISGTWPVRGERMGRMRDVGSNALASCIVLVCRSRPETAGVTDRRSFMQALKARLGGDLRVLQSGGVAPVDLAQAAIGPGMAVFSSFAKVVEPTGASMSVRTALSMINQVLDEVSAEQEGEFDEDTRWAISWYAEYGHDDGPYGRADDLARAKNVSVDGLVRAGIVKSGAGKVRLLDRDELDSSWDPSSDGRLTVWEVCQHLIRRLDEGADAAGELLARVGGLGEAARDLAYRLFQIAESKKWAKEAGPYNALAAEWPELTRIASMGPAGQGTLL